MMPFKYIFHSFIVPGSILVPIIMGLSKYNIAKTPFRIILYYLIVSGLINTTAIVLGELNIRNLPLLHLYTIVEAVFLLYYFKMIFAEPWIKKLINACILIFPLLCIINFSFFQSINSFNTYTRPLEAILITFFCMLYLYRSGFTENWTQQPVNWFNVGVLIYFPAAFIIFVLSNYIAHNPNKAMNTMVWNVHAALVLVMYLVWARGFKLIGNGR